MGQLQIKRYKQILGRMRNRVVARTDLTDLNETSSVNQVLAAAAREDDDQWYSMGKLLDVFDIDTAIGPDLDETARTLNPDLISRDQPKKATGAVVFSRVSTAGAVTIASGTEVQVPATSSAKALKFITTAEGTIADGDTDSGSVSVEASEAGDAYNVDVDAITGFANKPSGVTSVTNPAALTNGAPTETDDSFRTRIKLFVRSLSRATETSLIYAALTSEDTGTGKRVVFAAIVEDEVDLGHVVLYIDDGAGTAEAVSSVTDQTVIASAIGGEIDLYLHNKPVKIENTFTLKKNTVAMSAGEYTLNPASGHVKLSSPLAGSDSVTATYTYFTGLIAECQKIVDGDTSDRVNYPGYRSAGVLVRVLTPTIVQMAFTANITVKSGYSQTAVASKVKTAVSSYINGLGIGDDVILQELSERCMAVQGMFDILITSPTANRVILDTQLARVLAANITVS